MKKGFLNEKELKMKNMNVLSILALVALGVCLQSVDLAAGKDKKRKEGLVETMLAERQEELQIAKVRKELEDFKSDILGKVMDLNESLNNLNQKVDRMAFPSIEKVDNLSYDVFNLQQYIKDNLPPIKAD